MPVLLACAIEDSTDIFGISGGGVENPKPTAIRHCRRGQSKPSPEMTKSTKLIALGADQPSAFRLPSLRFSVIFFQL